MLKYIGIFFTIICIGLVSLYLVLNLGQPWWCFLLILSGVAIIGFAFAFLKKWWRQYKDKKRVNQIISENKTPGINPIGDSSILKDWNKGIRTLKESDLKKKGDPIYALPWYVILGESSSGKTTAIRNAGLASLFKEHDGLSEISETHTCDWWFYKQAVLIDTPGRWVNPEDKGKTRQEWNTFLSLLAKYRKKEPLNGLIITVSADMLLSGESTTLETFGGMYRKRINEMTEILGRQFPVYLLVTKCDRIQGMVQLCQRLPKKNLHQAAGGINRTKTKDTTTFSSSVIKKIQERLADLRLLFFQDAASADRSFLLLPDRFGQIKNGIHLFLEKTFQENVIQVTPLLRGLFFSCGAHGAYNPSREINNQSIPETSFFLRDLLLHILPKDRTDGSLYPFTQKAREQYRWVRNVGLSAWLMIMLMACSLVSYAFMKNKAVLVDAIKSEVLKHGTIDQVDTLYRFQEDVSKIKVLNQNWWIPRFGLEQSDKVEKQLTEKYCSQFSDNFLRPFDHKIQKKVSTFSTNSSEMIIAKHVTHIMHRITLLDNRLSGKISEIRLEDQPLTFNITDQMSDDAMDISTGDQLTRLYLYYVAWQEDLNLLYSEKTALQKLLTQVLALENTSWDWMITWINSDPSLMPISLSDFWGGSGSEFQNVTIEPAYTYEGYKKIRTFFTEIESVIHESNLASFEKRKNIFISEYQKAYFTAWSKFGILLPKGIQRLRGKDEWLRVMNKITEDSGVYFSFLDTLAEHMKPFSEVDNFPAGLALSLELPNIRNKAKVASVKDTSLVKKFMAPLKSQKVEETVDRQVNEAGVFLDYRQALEEIKQDAVNRNTAFQLFRQLYNETPEGNQSPFLKARHAIDKLKIKYQKGETRTEKMFWQLIAGPIDFMMEYVRKETACYIQDRWERDVLGEIREISDIKDMHYLFSAPDGVVNKFIKGTAAAFVQRNANGDYFEKEQLSTRIGISNDFLMFVTKGKMTDQKIRENYRVSIKGGYNSANKSDLPPDMTYLEIQCGTAPPFTMENVNVSASRDISWSPETCGDVVFKITVAGRALEPTKKYTGFYAFPKFLKDFSSGGHTFTLDDFSNEDQRFLQSLNIEYITARYELSNYGPLLRLLDIDPGKKVPESITVCWDR